MPDHDHQRDDPHDEARLPIKFGPVSNGEFLPPRLTPVLEETYRELRLPLLRLAFLLTGSRETAEDVVQSAFASVQPRWHRIDDPPAYLRRTVVNLAKDGQRREFRRCGLLGTEPEAVTAIPEIRIW